MALNIHIGRREKKLIVIVAVVFAIAFVLPQVLTEYASGYRSAELQKKQERETQIATLRKDLDGIEERKDILRRYIRRYQSLVDRDVITLPGPVDLVNKMKKISSDRRQKAVQFMFGDTRRLQSDETIYTKDSSVQIEIYPLELSMGMLHDLDIFMFMESIEEQVSSLAFPVKCSMERLTNDFVVTDRENMQATCQINWYSVNDPDRRRITPEEEEAEETEETAAADTDN
jgi:hypothetical protein